MEEVVCVFTARDFFILVHFPPSFSSSFMRSVLSHVGIMNLESSLTFLSLFHIGVNRDRESSDPETKVWKVISQMVDDLLLLVLLF